MGVHDFRALTITNTGTFEVQSGILTVGGPMTGAGNVVIYGATMEFAAASDANVQFSSAASWYACAR